MQAAQPDRSSSAATASAAALTATISASSCGQSPASCTTSMLRPICGSASGGRVRLALGGNYALRWHGWRHGPATSTDPGRVPGADLLGPIVGFDDARDEVAAHHVRSGEADRLDPGHAA